MTDLVKQVVDRFLSWKLPEDFNPDAGISFQPNFNEHTAFPMKHEPTGTNLFSATQATAMVQHILEVADIVALQAKLTARAKAMLKVRDVLKFVTDGIDDEGGRYYFGSTNDGEALKDIAETFDAWAWDDIMFDAQSRDYISEMRELRAEIERLTAALADVQDYIALDIPAVAAAAEREVCALVAETVGADFVNMPNKLYRGWHDAAKAIASAIRARGK